MKCPNCYSRTINNKKCEMCGKDITTFQIKKNSIKKVVIIIAIIIFLILAILTILNFNKISLFISSNPILIKARRNYKALIRIFLFLFFGITSVILMMRGSYYRNEFRIYDGYLLGKIVDYRPAIKKGFYHPIVEYIVNEKKYRVVGRIVKTKELEGLVGIRYNLASPIESIIDGEQNAELEFVIGLIMFIVVLTVIMI